MYYITLSEVLQEVVVVQNQCRNKVKALLYLLSMIIMHNDIDL